MRTCNIRLKQGRSDFHCFRNTSIVVDRRRSDSKQTAITESMLRNASGRGSVYSSSIGLNAYVPAAIWTRRAAVSTSAWEDLALRVWHVLGIGLTAYTVTLPTFLSTE